MNSHHQPTVLKFVMNRLNEHNTVHLDSHLHIIQTINFWFLSLLAFQCNGSLALIRSDIEDHLEYCAIFFCQTTTGKQKINIRMKLR